MAKSVVVTGPRQPAAVHQFVHQINLALGQVGPVVTYLRSPVDRPASNRRDSGTRRRDGRGPGEHAGDARLEPGLHGSRRSQFAANLKKVANTIYLAQENDETAALSKWVVPAAHYLESWGDAICARWHGEHPAADNRTDLYGGKTPAELVALVTGYKDQKAYDIVRNYWTTYCRRRREGLAQGAARRCRSGGGTQAAQRQRGTTAPTFLMSFPAPAPASGYEVSSFRAGLCSTAASSTTDGCRKRRIPITKLTWDNAALVSPATAKKLGVEMGDVISIERGGLKVEAAVVRPTRPS